MSSSLASGGDETSEAVGTDLASARREEGVVGTAIGMLVVVVDVMFLTSDNECECEWP